MSNIVRIEVRSLDVNPREHKIARQAREHLNINLLGAEELDFYLVSAQAEIPIEEVNDWAAKIFSDPILQSYQTNMLPYKNHINLPIDPSFVCEISFLPGVTDNIGHSAREALHLLSEFAREQDVKVYSGKLVFFYGEGSLYDFEKIATELLANPLIENIKMISWQDFESGNRYADLKVPEVRLTSDGEIKTFSLDTDDRALEKMSKENYWALTVAEIKIIRDYFADENVAAKRKNIGLPSDPTDIEMELLAQTWSEHCKHKIFNAEIDYTEELAVDAENASYKKLGNFTVQSIFKNYIKKATTTVQEKRKLDWLISVFSDNAGIVRFDDKIDLCIKVETHNSPSALDPYGGALTGIVGVNRDILGCGIGARPIANTDVFCFAPPNWPAVGEEKELPSGLKHPRRIFDGVHLGVEHGGNKSGIPTVNGAFAFHRDFAGKPLVFCGTIGVLPQKSKSNQSTHEKRQKVGDFIVMAGGRIGKDGIHGATFSSMELTEGTPSTVVQIGDPITQKRLADFLIEARDLELYSSLTDNGAGGLSSSVGEMATVTNGAELDVGLAPVKYEGLLPYELLVSESQERMTFSVPPEKWNVFKELAERRGVEVSNLGAFTDDGFLQIRYKEKLVGCIDLEFLHNGLPPMVLKANWSGPLVESNNWNKSEDKIFVAPNEMNSREFIEKALYKLLASWNIRSKEEWVRRYDHEVQGATVIKPFVGSRTSGPNDSGVIWLGPHGGSESSGVAIGCGLQPKLSRYDTYLMAQNALDEAVRNCVAVGADPDQVALIDNFCWPDPLPSEKNPDAHHKMAQLVRACSGLYDLACIYGAPFVSGKDSMKNDFIGKSRFGKEIKISVPPTVLVTAMAKVPQVDRTVTSNFKAAGDLIFLIGKSYFALGGSELTETYQFQKNCINEEPPHIDAERNLKLYRTVFQAMQRGLIRSCHDCSEGGMLISLVESALGSSLGVKTDLEKIGNDISMFGVMEFLFNETPGRFIISIAPDKVDEFKSMFASTEFIPFGTVTSAPIVRIARHGLVLVDAAIKDIRAAWKGEQKC